MPNIDELQEPSDSLNSITITMPEVYQALVSLDPNKASGFNNISPKVLQTYSSVLCEPLHHLFTMSLRYAVIPDAWKIHKIIPIFKAGDVISVRNYRPISFLSNTSRVLEHLIWNKLKDHIANFISPCQFGSTKGASTFNSY